MRNMAGVTATNRMTGMFSGIDTDALVKSLVSTQQAKVDKLFQNRERAQWKKDMYTDFNNQLRIFREDFGSVTGKNSMLSKGSFYNSKTDLASNKYLSATATSSAVEGSFKVRIDQVASAASMYGTRATDTQLGLSTSVLEKTAISDITSFMSGKYNSNGEFGFTINDKEFSFKSTDTLKTVMDTVNKSDAGVTMTYSQATDTFTISSKHMGEYKALSHPGEAPVNEQPFELTKPVQDDYATEEDYQEALAEYNEAKAEYDAGPGQVYKDALAAWKRENEAYLENEKRNITFSDTDGFLAHIGLSSVTAGADAKVSVNGGEVRTFSDNTITLDGVTLNLLSTTEPGQTIDFSVTRDTSEAAERVKTFVDSFNELVGKLYKAINTKKNKDYLPLTEEQRGELTESQAEKWDEKAKAGTLYRDDQVTKLYNGLRDMLSGELGGGRLKDIGITVAKYEVGEPFKLEFDADKLTQALSEDPELVYNIFAGAADGGAKGGLMTRVNASINDFTTTTKSISIDTLDKNILSLTKQMKTQDDKITDMAEKYYLQYAKLETALQQMQSQQQYMSGILGTGSGT